MDLIKAHIKSFRNAVIEHQIAVSAALEYPDEESIRMIGKCEEIEKERLIDLLSVIETTIARTRR
jgi:tRNA U34 5-carboxymethylaminomethyl modifying GTPase MnmE/TrmE